MKKIDVLKTGKLTDIIGPAGTLRRILRNRSFFQSKGLEISVYNGSRIYNDWTDTEFIVKKANKKTLKQRLRFNLDNWAKHSFILSVILVERKYLGHKKFVKNYLAEGRTPDVLVCHAEIECYYFLKLNKRKAVKTVLFYHNDGIPLKMYALYYPKLINSWYMKVLLRRYEYTTNHVDKCAFICEVGMKNINTYYPASKNKSFLVLNGIDDLTNEERKNAESIKSQKNNSIVELCCVGSVSIRKAQRKIIEALTFLPEAVRNRYHLNVVGAGPDLINCKKIVEQNNLEEVVTFEGAVPNTDVYKYLAKSDVFMLLSENEGMPISIIEAMRAGLAVISTNVSGIPELVSNGNGLLIEPDANKLAEILKHGEDYDWREMGWKSRELFEQKFTFERMRNDYVQMINSLF